MNKGLVTAIIVVVVIAIGAIVFMTQGSTGSPNNNATSTASTLTYDSPELGIAFSYPNTYKIELQHTDRGHVVVLMDKVAAANIPVGGEGPPSITVSEFDNSKNLPLADWIQETPQSNFQLSPDSALNATTLGGKPALAYRHSGLYESDAVAVEQGDKIFVFAAGWMDQNAQIRKDFQEILKTVQFSTPQDEPSH
ncbi:MAG TPA: hypothetical protein VD928_02745 [Candidatus Paceibacterota bacterium]|nr:hypothetical protein [Candidatus Paceibacterota bacterium]